MRCARPIFATGTAGSPSPSTTSRYNRALPAAGILRRRYQLFSRAHFPFFVLVPFPDAQETSDDVNVPPSTSGTYTFNTKYGVIIPRFAIAGKHEPKKRGRKPASSRT